jgi:RND family efflux transporter MFP subunit
VARAKAALAEQEITIEQAKVDKERAETLWKTRGISEQEYDQARFTYRSAVARRDSLAADVVLAEARKDQEEQVKDNMIIRAPFDGTVISKDAEVGESILPGGMGQGSGRGSVATIADLDHLEIQCDVQESFISRVTEGQEADIEVDAVQEKKYHGTVRKIIPMGDRARATIKVEVAIEDADALLFPEMAGTVYFLPNEQDLEVNDEPRVFCPTSAVDSDEEGNQFVWLADPDKRAQKVPIKAGEDRDGRTEVLEGLVGRERVIVNPEELYEGAPLQIVE